MMSTPGPDATTATGAADQSALAGSDMSRIDRSHFRALIA